MRGYLKEFTLIRQIQLVQRVVSVGEAPLDQPCYLICRQRLRGQELQPTPSCEKPQRPIVKSDLHPEVALRIAQAAFRSAVMYGLDIQLIQFH